MSTDTGHRTPDTGHRTPDTGHRPAGGGPFRGQGWGDPGAFDLSPEEARQLMDELWRVGIRPTEGAGSVGQLAATTRHLEDMRALVFHTARMTAP